MAKVTLGNTGITVEKNSFGALPIQRISMEAAVKLLRKAYEHGVTFYDTARFYTDSEEKLGEAFDGMREKVYIATKTGAADAEGFWKDIHTSLNNLRTDYIDLYQFHNPAFCPKPGDGSGLYEAMLEAKEKGMVRHIGITNHRLNIAEEAVESGLYETLQFPFCYLAAQKDMDLVEKCKRAGMGFIAMKALSGGLITNSAAAYAFLARFDNVLPIWGVQREAELDEFLSYIDNPPELTEELAAVIAHDREELSGDFCRGCGYCMPCPQNVDIPAAFSAYNHKYSEGSISALQEYFMCTALRKDYSGVANCIECGKCELHCPQHVEIRKELKNAKRHLETPVYKLGRWLVKRLKAY